MARWAETRREQGETPPSLTLSLSLSLHLSSIAYTELDRCCPLSVFLSASSEVLHCKVEISKQQACDQCMRSSTLIACTIELDPSISDLQLGSFLPYEGKPRPAGHHGLCSRFSTKPTRLCPLCTHWHLSVRTQLPVQSSRLSRPHASHLLRPPSDS